MFLVAFHELQNLSIFLIQRSAGIEHRDDNVALFDGADAALDPNTLYLVLGFANPCGIDKAHQMRADAHALFDGIACGAGYVADDRALVAKQRIEKTALTGIRLADDSHFEALYQPFAPLAGSYGSLELLGDLCKLLLHLLR